MDIWKFYDITHRKHVICNPTNEEKLARLVKLLQLPTGARVLDIACGKGEFIFRLAEAYDVSCVGIDISPFVIAEVERQREERLPDADVEFIEINGADYKPTEPHGFALAACIGASWIYNGHGGTLDALVSLVEPGGWVIAGEPFWLQEPPKEFLEASGDSKDDFGTHLSNAEAGETRGLELVHTFVSSKDDWDTYEGLQWHATAEYARAHPDDPDVKELVSRVEKGRATYLKWGRDTLGWAIYVFRRQLA